eukprot:SAG11_NODE_145_length_14811_cov_24.558931_6_plen_65_part_00
MRSIVSVLKASMINEQILLSVLIVLTMQPLIAILLVRLQEVAVSSGKELPASRLMLVLSWLRRV